MDSSLDDAERLEELFKYFLAASHSSGFAASDEEEANAQDVKPPHISSDPVLNGLCQLGAVRLDTHCAFVSLIDHEKQYIAAEMTKAGSLIENDRHPEGMPVALGATVLDHSTGICAGTLPAFLSDANAQLTSNIFADRSRYVIKDFAQERMYCSSPYITGYPHMRFYAEVPIKTASGFVIGSYAVIDSRARPDGLSEDEYLILADIAQAIMNHFENLKTEDAHNRASALLKGLDSFVQHNKERPKLDPSRAQSESRRRSSRTSSSTNSSTQQPDQAGRRAQSPEFARKASGRTPVLGSVAEQKSSRKLVTNPMTNGGNAKSVEWSPTEADASFNYGNIDDSVSEQTLVDAADSIKMTFAHAAHLLRTAMDIDGIVFLDAAYSGFGSRVEPDWLEECIADLPDKLEVTPSDRPIFPAMTARLDKASSMGMAPPLGSSERHSTPPRQLPTLPQTIQQSLIRTYPQGQVFVLAEEVSTTKINLQLCISSQSTVESQKRSPLIRKYLKRAATEEALRRYFPDAHSVTFHPLWDPYKSTWFAGSIGWSCQLKRTIENELFSFFAVFGNSIMMEIARLELVASDRAMSDCISSISHELRSPLHGILASAELLGDSLTNTEQKHMMAVIENCGQNLLQTMDQILDYSKINVPLVVHQPKGHKQEPQSSLAGISTINLAPYIEGVLQEFLIGDQYRKSRQLIATNMSAPTQSNSSSEGKPPAPIVTVSSAPSANVAMSSNSVAWHRIVLNLVGNAFKYTVSGSVDVSLRVVVASDPKSVDSIVLTVTDTGCGIEKAYLRDHLFTPFIQQNGLSPGVGLGMSIVKKIVDSLDGSIHVESKVGKGTRMIVSVPLAKDAYQTPILPTQYPGLTVVLLTPKDHRIRPAPEHAASSVIRDHLTRCMEDWYGIKVSKSMQMEDLPAKVVLLDERDLPAIMSSSESMEDVHISGKCTYIVVCTQHDFHDCASHVQSERVLYLSSPYGPQQLGALLEMALTKDISAPLTLQIRAKPKLGTTILMLPQAESGTSEMADRRGAEGHIAAIPVRTTTARSPPAHIPNGHHRQPIEEASRRPKILLVDDNDLNRSILVRITYKLGCEYETAADGLQAVQLFTSVFQDPTSRPFDYVFMDISMPVMDGFEATREIRSLERGALGNTSQVEARGRSAHNASEPATSAEPLPPRPHPEACQIIAMTGLGSAEAQAEALTSGMNKFLKKPVQIKTIRALLEKGD